MLGKLVPADVPNCKVTDYGIVYLTKHEMSLIMQQLEKDIIESTES